jgi:hypothetical protein
MGRTACTEPQSLYKGALYLLHVADEWYRPFGVDPHFFAPPPNTFTSLQYLSYFFSKLAAPYGLRPPHCLGFKITLSYAHHVQ